MSQDDDMPIERADRPRPAHRRTRLSGPRLRMPTPPPEQDEPAPTLRQFARWMGYFALRPGPHATWDRPLSKGSLVERLEQARNRLRSSLRPAAPNPADDDLESDGARDTEGRSKAG